LVYFKQGDYQGRNIDGRFYFGQLEILGEPNDNEFDLLPYEKAVSMKESLDQFAHAYEPDTRYSLDARLMSGWYPRRVVEKSSGISLLELGIGHGRAVSFFSDNFDRHVVIEGSEEVIRQYIQKYGDQKSDIVHGYFESFNTDEKFDYISMGFVLEHVDDPVLVLTQFSRFLKADGIIYIAVPNATSLHRQLGVAAGLLGDIKQLSEDDLKLGHQRYYDIADLRADVRKAGLFEQSLEGIFLKPFTTAQLEQLSLTQEILESLMVVGKDYPELCNAILMEVILNSKDRLRTN
jgi:SAM-dependent methyltransferase